MSEDKSLLEGTREEHRECMEVVGELVACLERHPVDPVGLQPNIGIEQFPDVIVARMFGFGARELLEFDGVDIADVNMKQLFDS